eukprot:756055-Hanusia_phi.AAC.4
MITTGKDEKEDRGEERAGRGGEKFEGRRGRRGTRRIRSTSAARTLTPASMSSLASSFMTGRKSCSSLRGVIGLKERWRKGPGEEDSQL